MNYNVITNVNNIDKKEWSEFVENHPDGNIFQTPEMYEVYEATPKYNPVYLSVEDENEEIVASLLAVIQKEHSGFLGKFSSRSIIWGGPIIKNDNLNVLDFILSEYNKIIKNKAIYSQFRNLWEWSDVGKDIFRKNGFNYEEHLDIIHDLTKPINDQLMHQIKLSKL